MKQESYLYKFHEATSEINAVEMRILRRMIGVTLMYKVENNLIREQYCLINNVETKIEKRKGC